MPEKIAIFCTTLRDGEQSPGASMNIEEKLIVAQQLERLNVDVIEAGFPISSEGDFEAVKRIAQTVRKPQIAALCRANFKDIDRAWEALKYARNPRIHTFIATSDIHMKYKLRKTREQVLEEAVKAVRYAKRYCDNIEFSAEDATRSDRDFLCQVFEAVINEGATVINVPDTVGYAIPLEYGELIRYIMEHVPNINKVTVSTHCHDDLGLAVANSLMAILNGARQIECTINGIGERAGNTSLEEVVMAIKTRKDFLNFETQIVTEQIYPTSRLVSQITGIQVPPNKAIVGGNAFAHEAGIHQDGVLKEKLTYEIMRPEEVGIPKSTLVMGKHSGRHAFRQKLKELGFDLNDEELDKAFERFKSIADKKKVVYDEDLVAIVTQETFKWPERYKLLYLNVVSGTQAVPTATVKMEIDGKIVQDAGFGVGPVDATYQTIAKITNTASKLINYQVKAITGGTDAQGEVMVKLEEGGFTVVGHGAHVDIIVASAEAYINALNKLEYIKNTVKALKGSV